MAEVTRPAPGASRRKPSPPASGRPSWWTRLLEWISEHPKQASALAGLIVAALPAQLQLVGSMLLNVPISDVLSGLRQNKLWELNLACASAPFDGLATAQNLQVDAVVCQSGDVLVRVKSPNGSTAYRWVPVDSVVERVAQGFGLIGSAHAAPMRTAASPPLLASLAVASAGGGNFKVVCQKWIGNGRIKRRILDAGSGRCYDEVVNTYSGKVESTAPAPDCRCQEG